jgi:phage terminase small subunit
MTAKQQRFVTEYLTDLNATQAAIRAGYGAKNADVVGPRLLGNVGIADGKARQLAAAELTAAATLEEIRRVGFSDIGALYDDDGRMKPLRELPPAVRATIASVKTTKKNLTVGDGTQEDVVEVRLWDKLRALEMAAKHFALLTDRLDHCGEIVLR